MMSITITRHGNARMSQRGIRRSDLDTLLTHGTEISPNRFMLRNRDAATLIQERKNEIARLERLAGKEAVVADGHLITAYHRTRPNRPFRRKTGRRGERRSTPAIRSW